MLSSLDGLTPELQKQYRNLTIYTFMIYIFNAFYYVFQTLYFVSLGFPLPLIFIIAALSPIFSLLFQNNWSKIADQTQHFKRYILLGNVFFIVGSIITVFAFEIAVYTSAFWMMLLLTLIGNLSPSSDSLANVLVYKLSDRVTGITNDSIEKHYHNLNLFARYRRYGSFGFALGLPFMSAFLILFHLNLSIVFWTCAIGVVPVSLWFNRTMKEEIILLPPINPEKQTNAAKNNKAQEIKPGNSSLWQNYRRLFTNRIFAGFVVASLIFYIASSSTDNINSLFFNQITNGDWFALVWFFSIAAFVEWPVMTIVAKQVKKIGWQKMIVVVYILTGIRIMVMSLILHLYGANGANGAFGANWAIFSMYLLQAFSGTLFGLNWPTTTFGLYISLPDDQKTLGQSFFGTMQSIASFIGMVISAIFAWVITDKNEMYTSLYWFLGIIAICGGVLFFITNMKSRKRGIGIPPQIQQDSIPTTHY